MKICVAQPKPVKADIQSNIANHKRLMELAYSHGAEAVFFPELSLTGYEPALSQELASTPDDHRFGDFQRIADTRQVLIGVGVPTRNHQGVCISMVIFQPRQSRQVYSKKYLHPDEEAFFVAGRSSTGLIGRKTNLALAICYELSIPEHAEGAFKSGAEIYVASVAKSTKGVEQASRRLSEIAKSYAMTVLMSNCIGPCGGIDCAGQSSIWNSQGLLIGHLNGSNEGILMIDTQTQEIFASTPQRGPAAQNSIVSGFGGSS